MQARRHIALTAILLSLTACVPPAPRQQNPQVPIPFLPIETATGELDITPEPFVDPLAPVSLTGAVTIQERTLSGGILEIGSARAGERMTVFLNVESPYAREFQRSRMPLLIEEFVSKGRLSVRIFILPIEKYAGSAESARTIECAAAQGKGYPALELLFVHERTTLTQEDVTELELEAMLFQNCIQTQLSDPLAMARAEAATLGITLTPTYVLDDDIFVGLPSEADLLGAVRAAL